jgi:CDGSH-type Zn-finger protein
MADEPKIAGTEPIAVDLEAGKQYAWCRCGQSSKQPFCDGSHTGTSFKPHVFKAEKSGQAYLCMCKRTGNAPFCDGTHASLDTND